MKHTIFILVIVACSTVLGEVRKIASIKINDVGKVEAESVALEDSEELANTVAEAVVASTNLPFAKFSRGDNSWNVTPFDITLAQIKPDEGSGGIDPETGEYHFTVERYWFDPDAERGSSGLPADRIVATLKDTTFNNTAAVAQWDIYISDELFSTVVAPIGVYTINFGGGVIANLNPIETVVYSAELERTLDVRLASTTNTLSSVAFTGDYRSLSNIPDHEIRASKRNGKIVYQLFQTTPTKE